MNLHNWFLKENAPAKQSVTKNELSKQRLGIEVGGMKTKRSEKLDGIRILTRFFKNFAAICFSDNILTGKEYHFPRHFSVQNFVTEADGCGILCLFHR